MKRFLIVVCVILAVLAYAQANTCVIKGRTLNVGESYSEPGKCSQVKCVRPNSIVGETCPDEQAGENCKKLPQDNSKPYPDCCPRFEC